MNDELKKQIKIQERILELLEVLVKEKLYKIIQEETKDAKLKLLYQLTGEVSREEIVRQTGFSAGKVSGTWQRWETLGIFKKEGQSYRKVI